MGKRRKRSEEARAVVKVSIRANEVKLIRKYKRGGQIDAYDYDKMAYRWIEWIIRRVK